MIKYCGSMNVNIILKSESRFINIATARPYTQEIKNSKNGGLPCKHFYLENIFNISLWIVFLIIDESNNKFATDQIICKTSLKHVLKVYAPNIAFIMPSNHLSYLCFIQYFIQHFYWENIFNISLWTVFLIIDESNYKFATDQIIRKTSLKHVPKVYAPNIAVIMPSNHLSYLCFIQYFISRTIMPDQTSEPMDIEGEAVCAVGPQLVTAEGEQGAGVDVKRIFSHLEADTLLLSDDG